MARTITVRTGTIIFNGRDQGRTLEPSDELRAWVNPAAPNELAPFSSAEAFSGGRDDGHDPVLHDDHLFSTAQNSHAMVVLKVSDRLLRRAR